MQNMVLDSANYETLLSTTIEFEAQYFLTRLVKNLLTLFYSELSEL
jgi:hypothetical protein